MTKEEFERLKEEEKAHLREIRRLKGQLREAERTAKMHRAVGEMASSLQTPDLDEQTEILQRRAAEAEARLEVALESHGITDPSQPVLSAEEERKLKAEALIAQMKAQLGALAERATPDVPPNEAADSGKEANGGESSPEKTIGRKASSNAAPPEPEPEKTIGRGSARRRASGEEGQESR